MDATLIRAEVGMLPADTATRLWFSKLKVGDKVRADVSKWRPIRSDQQNRYLWGVVYPTILEAGKLEGWTAEEVHDYCLGEHFGWETVEGFGRKKIRPIRRSSKLNKMEFVDYIAFIQQRMAEHGIYVPDPDQELAS